MKPIFYLPLSWLSMVSVFAFTTIAQADDGNDETSAQANEKSDAPTSYQDRAATRFAAEFTAGYGMREIYDIGLHNADFQLGIGFSYKHFAMFGEAQMLVGSTSGGLATRTFMGGLRFDMILGRFHGGLGVNASQLNIDGVSGSGVHQGGGVGFSVVMSYDLVKFDDHALYLQARFDGTRYLNDDPFVYGPTIGVGFRY